jgi:Phosphotransferase enzyme family
MTVSWIEQRIGAPAGSLSKMTYSAVGTGQMCDSFRLHLVWNDFAGPLTVIAKCPSADPHSRNIAAMVRNYELEISWYRSLAASTPVNCPHCYHAEIADNGIDFALLLADCAPAKQGDQLAGADLQSIKAAIAEMAALHASHWNGPELDAHDWLHFGRANKEIVRQLMPTLYPEFCTRYRGRLNDEILAMGQHLVEHIGDYLDAVPAALTVVHGDFRLDNLLFETDGGVTVVDWQTVGIGSPMADLAYLIGTSIADPAVRAAEEAALFGYYCDLIEARGVSFARQPLWQDYRRYAYSGFIMAVFASMNVARTPRGDEMFAVMAERPSMQVMSLNSAELLHPVI